MRALGIDYGERRIGLALSDPTGLLASPWKTLVHRGALEGAADEVAAEVRELAGDPDGLSVIVIGLPRRLGGEPTTQTARVTAFADRLRARVAISIVLQDERLSSREAESLLARREPDWRKRKARLDAMSACVVLQDYLDGLPRDEVAPADRADWSGDLT